MTAAPNAPCGRCRVVVSGLRASLLAFIVLLAPATARAQDKQDKRLSSRLDPGTAVAVSRLVDSVRAAGLPSDALVGVALEGASRRVSNDRILAAVREYASALGSARQTLGPAAAGDEIVSAAGVLVAGVSPGVLGAYRDARPSGSLTVALVVLADLIARGVPVDTASKALGDALRGGALDDDLSELRRRVERDILAGLTPAAAMAVRTRGLPGLQPPSASPFRRKPPRSRRPGLR